MPKAIKKRKTKKTEPKEEKVKGAIERSLDALKKKKRNLIIVLLVLGTAAVAVISFMIYSSSTTKKAYSFERDAFKYYYNIDLTDEERLTKSLELFQKSIEVKPTAIPQFYIGNCYFNLGDYDNAVKAYNEVIDEYKNNDSLLPLVYQKLASAYVKNGKNNEAIKTLNALAQFKNGIFKDTALILMARLYERTGKTEGAMEKYKELVKDFPFSLWTDEAMKKIGVEETKENKE